MHVSCVHPAFSRSLRTHFAVQMRYDRTMFRSGIFPRKKKAVVMGPSPHDAPPAKISKANPAGTDGFEFVEFAHQEPEKLSELFTRMGYTPVARHRTKNITVWRQGDINYVVNAERGSHAMKFVAKHGPCAPAMAWR